MTSLRKGQNDTVRIQRYPAKIETTPTEYNVAPQRSGWCRPSTALLAKVGKAPTEYDTVVQYYDTKDARYQLKE